MPTHYSFHPTFEPECATLHKMLSLHQCGAEKRQSYVSLIASSYRENPTGETKAKILLILHYSPLNGQHRGLCNSQVPHCINTLQWQNTAMLSHHFSVAPDKDPEPPV